MLSLNDREWKEFKIIEVLGRSQNAKAYHSDMLSSANKEHGIAYITRTNLNNGLYDVVQEQENFIINPKDSISLGAENATYFYQPYKYITGNKMYFYKKEGISKYALLFLTNCLNKAIKDCGFGYGMGLTGARSDTRTFLLPIDSCSNPDYEFMEEYIKQRIKIKHDEYHRFLNKQTNKHKLIEEPKWKEFSLSQLFEIKLSKGDNQAKKLNDGRVPLVSAGGVNNGICKYIDVGDSVSERFKENVLTIDMFGKAYFQPSKFFAVSHGRINILIPKFNMNKDIGSFFVTAIEQRFYNKYSFANMCSQSRLLRERILLPCDINDVPNYKYMEQYTKNKMHDKYKRYLDFIARY